MRDESALLKAILAAPDDDTVRLAYADWLQENDRPERAEFIRIECEQATIEPDPFGAPSRWENPRYWEIEERRKQLRTRHAAEWFGPLFRADRFEMQTHRGFPYHVALGAKQFLDRGAELFRAAPTIEDVFLGRLGPNTPKLAKCPALGRVRALTFFETPFYAAEAIQFFASPHLGNLREFSIPFTDTQIGYAGALALAGAKSLSQLRKLDLGNHEIVDLGARVLFESERFATLTDIHFGSNALTDYTLAVLNKASHLKLTELNLMRNHLSGAGLTALHAKHLAGLESLALTANELGFRGADNLAKSPCAANLRHLQLANCGFDDSSTGHLLRGSWPQLTELGLSLNRFGLRAARALGENTSLVNLTSLALREVHISATTARWLGRAELPALRELDLSGNAFEAKGLAALLTGALVRPVQSLNLGSTELGDDGAEELARRPAVTNIRSLRLERNRITNRGALALAESPHLENVESLDLDENKIEKKGREALVRRFGARVDFGS